MLQGHYGRIAVEGQSAGDRGLKLSGASQLSGRQGEFQKKTAGETLKRRLSFSI